MPEKSPQTLNPDCQRLRHFLAGRVYFRPPRRPCASIGSRHSTPTARRSAGRCFSSSPVPPASCTCVGACRRNTVRGGWLLFGAVMGGGSVHLAESGRKHDRRQRLGDLPSAPRRLFVYLPGTDGGPSAGIPNGAGLVAGFFQYGLRLVGGGDVPRFSPSSYRHGDTKTLTLAAGCAALTIGLAASALIRFSGETIR